MKGGILFPCRLFPDVWEWNYETLCSEAYKTSRNCIFEIGFV